MQCRYCREGVVYLDHGNSSTCNLHKYGFVSLKTLTGRVVNHVESTENCTESHVESTENRTDHENHVEGTENHVESTEESSDELGTQKLMDKN